MAKGTLAGWLFLLPLLAAGEAFALEPGTPFSQYGHRAWTMEDGLPQSTVQSIVQTRDGYIYMGTQEGLARFDGVRFRAFGKREIPGAKNTAVLCLEEGADGTLWLGTNGSGLLRYRDGRFQSYGAADGLADSIIWSLHEDREGTLWLGTDNGGLIRFKGGAFTAFAAKHGLPPHPVFALEDDGEGGLWVGTFGGGLVRFRGGSFSRPSAGVGPRAPKITSLLRDRSGTLYVGTYGDGAFRHEGGRFVPFETADVTSREFIASLFQDSRGTLWIGTYGGGVIRLCGGRADVYTEKDGLSGKEALAFCEDREGSLWIGCEAAGVNQLRDVPIASFSKSEGLSEDSLFSVCEDADGAVWVATNGGGACRLRGGSVSRFTWPQIPHPYTRSVYPDPGGGVWIGTNGRGFCLFRDGRSTVYTQRDGLSNDTIRSFFRDRAGALWIGTYGGGLNRFAEGRFTSFTTKDGLPHDSVFSISEDREGGIWGGTLAGIFRLHDGRITRIHAGNGLSSNQIIPLYADAEGSLWIGTVGGGLNRLRTRTEAAGPVFDLTCYTTEDGLFDDSAFAILEDGEGYLWMSCNNGLYRVLKKDLDEYDRRREPTKVHRVRPQILGPPGGAGQPPGVPAGDGPAITVRSDWKLLRPGKLIPCRAFGAVDGMRNKEGMGGGQPTCWKARDGRLWFVTVEGAVAVDPRKLKGSPLPPPVVIESFLADGQEVSPPGWRPAEPPGRAPEVTLAPGKRAFEFHFTALSYLVPERVRFLYRVSGFDRDWVDAGTRRVAYYTNIPPGSYTFQVVACNADGVWNRTGASLPFELRPFFYQAFWFRFLAALSVLGAFYGAYRMRSRQIRRKAAQLEQIVGERTNQLRESNRQLGQANEKLQSLAVTDPLTGLANHRKLKDFLDHEWSRAQRTGSPLSAIMADVDYFKNYNDAYGHLAGDECLRRVAGELRLAAGREVDLPGRYGGEEFLVVLVETDLEGALRVAERIREAVESLQIPHRASAAAPHVTLSLGVHSRVPGGAERPDDLIEGADRALYQAKRLGRNRVVGSPG